MSSHGLSRHDLRPGQTEPLDHEGEQRTGKPERDGPADLLPGRVREVRQLERLERVRAGAQSGPVRHADEDERSDARRDQSRDQDERRASRRPGRSLRSRAPRPRWRDPKITEMAAKLPAAASTMSSCGGASRFASFTAKTARPPPIAINGASGPSTRPRPRVASAASATPGHLGRLGAAHLQPVGRHVPAVAGQLHDRERHREPREHEHRDRPPRRHGVESERVGQVAEHRELDLVDELEEPPRGERHEETDHRGEHEHHDEVAAAQHRLGIKGWRRGRGRLGGCVVSAIWCDRVLPGPGARRESIRDSARPDASCTRPVRRVRRTRRAEWCHPRRSRTTRRCPRSRRRADRRRCPPGW